MVSCIIDDLTCTKVFSNALLVMIDAYRSK
jgi:hypothetical protein